jgi:HSP20 family protein
VADTQTSSTQVSAGAQGGPPPGAGGGTAAAQAERSQAAHGTQAEGRASKAGATATQAAGAAAEAAGNASKAAAGATREVAERSRSAMRDAAESWRGATEPFLSMQSELNHWFDDLWRQATGMGVFPALRPSSPFAALGSAPMFGLPAVDIKETDDAYKICAELPGLTPDDVELEIKGDALVLTGHKVEEKDDHRAAYRISERRFGRFERRFPLPGDVDRQRIDAGFKDGVLTVTLPRQENSQRSSNRIQVRS